MSKKILLLGSALAFFAHVTTANAAVNEFYNSSLLLGLHIGFSHLKGKFNSTVDLSSVPLASSSASGTKSKTYFMGGALIGYRHIFSNGVTLGPDVSVNFFGKNVLTNNVRQTATASFFNEKIVRRYSIIPGVTLGKVFAKRFHVGLGLGLGISKFDHQVDNLVPGGQGSAKASRTKLGFVPSLGLEVACTKNVSVTANLAYEIYSKASKTLGGIGLFPGFAGFPVTYTTSVKPRFVTGRVGVLFRF